MSPRRLLIRGGLFIDPARGLEARRDVLIAGTRISAVRPRIKTRPGPGGPEILDARGLASGANLEFASTDTIPEAITGRQPLP